MEEFNVQVPKYRESMRRGHTYDFKHWWHGREVFALIVLTIVFKDKLSVDHCIAIGIMGFMIMISGVLLSTCSDD